MRIPVEKKRAYRLLNHGPTTLIGSRHAGRTNLMAAQWVMPLDFEPPKLVAVISSDCFSRTLIDASGVFGVSIPTIAQRDLVTTLGHTSGADLDKLERFAVRTFRGTELDVPLVEGCVAWLECRVIPEPAIQKSYDLFVAEVLAAWVEEEVWTGKGLRLEGDRRTLHHVAGGRFFASGEALEGRELEPRP